MYLTNRDTFVDTIKDSGHNKMQIIFDPEYLRVFNSDGDNLKLLRTGRASFYKMNLINVDLQEQQSIEIKLSDKRTKTYKNRLRRNFLRSNGVIRNK